MEELVEEDFFRAKFRIEILNRTHQLQNERFNARLIGFNGFKC